MKNSIFSDAYQIEDFLKKKDWVYSPLEISSIYDTVILPYYLETKPEEAGAQWDARINAELAMQKITMSESEYAIYYKERQPELAWQKDRFLLENNINAIMAVADMLKIVRENPNHAQAATWLQTLRQIVVSSQGEPTTANPTAGAGATPAPAPAPATGAGTN